MRCVISTLVALAASVNALGSAIVLNNSTSPIYLWSVDSSVGPEQTIALGKVDHCHCVFAGKRTDHAQAARIRSNFIMMIRREESQSKSPRRPMACTTELQSKSIPTA